MNYDYDDELKLYDDFDKINNDYTEFIDMNLKKWQSWYGNNEKYNDFDFEF